MRLRKLGGGGTYPPVQASGGRNRCALRLIRRLQPNISPTGRTHVDPCTPDPHNPFTPPPPFHPGGEKRGLGPHADISTTLNENPATIRVWRAVLDLCPVSVC